MYVKNLFVFQSFNQYFKAPNILGFQFHMTLFSFSSNKGRYNTCLYMHNWYMNNDNAKAKRYNVLMTIQECISNVTDPKNYT